MRVKRFAPRCSQLARLHLQADRFKTLNAAIARFWQQIEVRVLPTWRVCREVAQMERVQITFPGSLNGWEELAIGSLRHGKRGPSPTM